MNAQILMWMQAIQIVFTIALAIYTWRSRQEAARSSQVKALEAASALQDRDIALIKQRLDAMPCDSQCRAFGEMTSAIAVLKERTEHLDEWLVRMSNIVDRIDTYLRENK